VGAVRISEAVGALKKVPLDGGLVRTARALGISVGTERAAFFRLAESRAADPPSAGLFPAFDRQEVHYAHVGHVPRDRSPRVCFSRRRLRPPRISCGLPMSTATRSSSPTKAIYGSPRWRGGTPVAITRDRAKSATRSQPRRLANRFHRQLRRGHGRLRDGRAGGHAPAAHLPSLRRQRARLVPRRPVRALSLPAQRPLRRRPALPRVRGRRHGGASARGPCGSHRAFPRRPQHRLQPHQPGVRHLEALPGGMAQALWMGSLDDGNFRKITDWRGSNSWPMWRGDAIYFVSDGRGGR